MERKENALCQNYLNFDLPLGTQVQHDRVYRKRHRSQGPGDGQAATPPKSPQGREERFCAHIPICLCHCGYCYQRVHHSNNLPHPQTGCWRWLNSGQPQNWSLRSDWGSRPPAVASITVNLHQIPRGLPWLLLLIPVNIVTAVLTAQSVCELDRGFQGGRCTWRLGQHGQSTET